MGLEAVGGGVVLKFDAAHAAFKRWKERSEGLCVIPHMRAGTGTAPSLLAHSLEAVDIAFCGDLDEVGFQHGRLTAQGFGDIRRKAGITEKAAKAFGQFIEGFLFPEKAAHHIRFVSKQVGIIIHKRLAGCLPVAEGFCESEIPFRKIPEEVKGQQNAFSGLEADRDRYTDVPAGGLVVIDRLVAAVTVVREGFQPAVAAEIIPEYVRIVTPAARIPAGLYQCAPSRGARKHGAPVIYRYLTGRSHAHSGEGVVL